MILISESAATADGGFILGGYTESPQGDDISQPALGGY